MCRWAFLGVVTALSVKNFASLPIMFSPKEQLLWRGLEARACVQLCDSKVLHIVVTAGQRRRTKACAALLINPKLKNACQAQKAESQSRLSQCGWSSSSLMASICDSRLGCKRKTNALEKLQSSWAALCANWKRTRFFCNHAHCDEGRNLHLIY